ncbi:MAG: MATE family efflux transporter [Gammaproteobacteria bacterium]
MNIDMLLLPLFKPYKEMLTYFVPILCINVVDVLVMLINTIMGGDFNHQGLAAIGLVVATYLASMTFCWGVLTAVLIITANKKGEEATKSNLGLILVAGLILALLLSIPVMFIFRNAEPIWILLGQDPQVTQIGQTFFSGAFTIALADLGKYVILKFLVVLGKLRLAIIANLLILPLLVLCNTLLMDGYWGLPKLGIYGLGLGTAITYWLVLIGLIVHLFYAKYFRGYLFHSHKLINYWHAIISVLKLGVPIGIMFTMEAFFFFTITMLMGNISVLALAAYQIAMQYVWVSMMFSASLAETTSILAGKAYGATNLTGVLQVTYAVLSFSFICLFTVALLYWFGPRLVINAELSVTEMNDQVLVALAIKFLAAAAVYQLFDSGRLILSGALRAMFDSVYPMLICVLSFWFLGLSIGSICAFFLKWGGIGLWCGLISAVVTSVLLLYLRLQKNLHNYSWPPQQ